MDKFSHIKTLKDTDFRRLTGVKRTTFDAMLELLYDAEKLKKKTGKPKKISIPDRLLLALEYLRENRTFFHISQGYRVHETTAIRICHWVENTLIKSKKFSLPSKKILQEKLLDWEVVIVDATEIEIERPKKSKKNITLEKRKNTL